MPYNRYCFQLEVEWVKLEDLIDLAFDLVTLLGYGFNRPSILSLFLNYKKYPKLGNRRFPDDFFVSNTDPVFAYLRQSIVDSVYLFQIVPLSRALLSYSLNPATYTSRKSFEESYSLVWND